MAEKVAEIQLLLVEGYVSVIAEVAYHDEDNIMIKNAARVVPQQNQQGQLMAALIPFIFGSKKDDWVKFPREKIVTDTVPEDFLLKDYKRAYGCPDVEVVKNLPIHLKRK